LQFHLQFNQALALIIREIKKSGKIEVNKELPEEGPIYVSF